MRRKKATIKRPRRSPYERSLEYATKRLAKATEEQRSCQLKLESLNKEIPYLQGVIRVLTPRKDTAVAVFDNRINPNQNGLWGRANTPSIFTPPTASTININVDELPSEEDQFLNVAIPGEKEVLP